MLLYGSLSDPVPLADGSIQVTATVAPGPNDPRAALIDPAILRAAAAEFFSGAPVLLEQFTLAGTAAGGVDDLSVTSQGAIDVTLTVKGDAAAKKVAAGVYKSAALALRVTARDPATGAVAKAQIYAASLIDRADDPAFLAKAMPAGGAVRDAMGLIHGLEHSLLEIGARLTRYERSRR